MGNRNTEKTKRRRLRKRQREHPEQRPGYRGHNKGQHMSFRDALDLVPDDMPYGAAFALAHEMAGLEYGDGFDELADE